MARKWIFGIDGGGTKSRLRVEAVGAGADADSGGSFPEREPLFYGEGGGTNPRSNSPAAVAAALSGLFGKAYGAAALAPGDCAGGFAGSAGVDREADNAPFVALVREAAGLAAGVPVFAGNDSEPALAGALGDVEGFLLIAGTGSIALGRTRDGSRARAGGWGHLLGDEGSAWRIAFDALARALRSWEGRDLPTGLLPAGLSFFGLEDPLDFIPFFHEGLDKTKVARFAPVVAEFRDRGDPLAIDLFDRAERELSALVVSVDARIGAKLSRKRLVLSGGLIEGDARLRSGVEDRLRRALPTIEFVPAASDAASGACLLARASLGLSGRSG